MAYVDYRPMLAEVRDLTRDIRKDSGISTDPRGVGLRTWAKHVKLTTGYETTYRQVKRFEEGPESHVFDVAYLLACAITTDCEVVLGRDARIIVGGVRGQARDFLRHLRTAAATDPSIPISATEALQDEIDRALFRPARKVG